MHPATAESCADELEKIADLASRKYMNEPKKAPGGLKEVARSLGTNALHRFGQMGTVGKSAVLSGLLGASIGGINGLTSNYPVFDRNVGSRYPSMGDRARRSATWALVNGGASAALGGGSMYLLRKAFHA